METDGLKGLELIAVRVLGQTGGAVWVKVSVKHGGEGFDSHNLHLWGPGDQKTERSPPGSLSQPQFFMDEAARSTLIINLPSFPCPPHSWHPPPPPTPLSSDSLWSPRLCWLSVSCWLDLELMECNWTQRDEDVRAWSYGWMDCWWADCM